MSPVPTVQHWFRENGSGKQVVGGSRQIVQERWLVRRRSGSRRAGYAAASLPRLGSACFRQRGCLRFRSKNRVSLPIRCRSPGPGCCRTACSPGLCNAGATGERADQPVALLDEKGAHRRWALQGTARQARASLAPVRGYAGLSVTDPRVFAALGDLVPPLGSGTLEVPIWGGSCVVCLSLGPAFGVFARHFKLVATVFDSDGRLQGGR